MLSDADLVHKYQDLQAVQLLWLLGDLCYLLFGFDGFYRFYVYYVMFVMSVMFVGYWLLPLSLLLCICFLAFLEVTLLGEASKQ